MENKERRVNLVFGEDRICPVCRGRRKQCERCGGSGVVEEKVRRSPEPPLDLERGKVLRDEGMEKVERAESSWIERAYEWIHVLKPGVVFTSDHLTQRVGLPESRNGVGAVISGARRRGMIEFAGISQSARPERHAGTVRLWRRI